MRDGRDNYIANFPFRNNKSDPKIPGQGQKMLKTMLGNQWLKYIGLG